MEQAKGKWDVKTIAIFIVLIVVAIIGLSVCSSGACDTGITDTEGHAIVAAKNAVRDQLKAPSTAKFSSVWASKNNDGTWVVKGYVDAQNSFGATIRSSFKVMLKYNGSSGFIVTSVIIN